MRTKYFIAFALIVTLLCDTPAYAQNPLKKPEKPTQTTPAPKSSSSTTSGKSSNKSSSSSSSAQSFTSSSSSTQQSQTSSSSGQIQAKKPATGYINGHEYVDLGLSVKWATCNVGASSPSDYGNYYAWGETSTKSSYTDNNSLTYGKNMGSIAGNSTYDAARANWGGTWRLPTIAEIDELINKCTRVWTTQGGHRGYKVTGPNGNSIFLPAAGWRDGTSLRDAGEGGYYWSATPYEDDTNSAYSLGFGNGYFGRGWGYRRRSFGQSVRPVSE